jgi:membrane protease subunit (stomatin/prohibitin family)
LKYEGGSIKMGFMDFVKKQFLDIIEWEDNTQDTLVYKFPMRDNEIQNNAKLVIRPGQCAIFLDEGRIADVFTEPETYTLNTQTLPVLTNLKNWAYGFKSPFKSDVYFVNIKQFMDQKWGTPAPILIPDPKFEQVEIRAFGNFSFRISDPRQFLTTVTSTNRVYTADQIREQLKSFILSNFAPIVVKQKVTVAQLVENYHIIDEAVMESVKEKFSNLGLEITSFNILNISLQEEYQEMLRKRSAVNIAGGMQNYAQIETLDAMKESVKNPGMNGAAQAGMGLGMGMGMAGMFSQNMQGAFNNPSSPRQDQGGNAASGQIECGNCKAKIPSDSAFCGKCGTKVQALFCSKCGNKAESGAAFCSKCGNKLG